MKYLKNKWAEFIESFKNLDKGILMIAMYRLIFYFAVIFSWKKLSGMILGGIEPLVAFASTASELTSAEMFKQQTLAFQSFYTSVIIYFIIAVLVTVTVYIATNMLIWNTITGKKLKKSKFELRFLGMNLIWVLAWGLLSFLLLMSIRTNVIAFFFLGIVLLYAHLTTLLYIAFYKKKKIGKSIRSAFGTGFAKIKSFIVPYLLAFVLFLLLNFAVAPLGRITVIPVNTIYFIVFLFYFAWFRTYIYSFAKKLV